MFFKIEIYITSKNWLRRNYLPEILLPCFLSQNYKTEAKISHMCVKQHLRCNWCWRLNHYSEIFRLFLVIQFIVHRVAVGQWSVVCGAVAGYTGQPRARGKRRREHGQKTSWLLLLLKNAPNTPIWLLPLDDS